MKIKSDDLRFNISISNNALKIQCTQTACQHVAYQNIIFFLFYSYGNSFYKTQGKHHVGAIYTAVWCVYRVGQIASRYNIQLTNITYDKISGEIRRRNYIKIKRSDFRVVHKTQLLINYYYRNVNLLS